jgi:ArsR family transcriptional regulator, arsenate/arsenite/antimonite-responsive transcriptional repressor
LKHTVKQFKALADENRIRILKMLEVRPLCVCEITELLRISTSTVSKHLAILRNAGFITDQKDGKFVVYALIAEGEENGVRELLDLVRSRLTNEKEIKIYERKLAKLDRYTLCQIQ